MSASTTYYAQTTNSLKTYTLTTDKNVESATGEDTTLTCNIAITYNGVAQENSCSVTLPNNPYKLSGWTFIGWNTNKDAHEGITGNVDITENTTYYVIWTKPEIIRTATFTKQGTGVTSIGNNTLSCTIESKFNGAEQETTCDITSPSINVAEGYTAIGWNTDTSSHEGITGDVTLSSDITYYSISKKNPITLTAKWNANGATLSNNEDSTCTIQEVYNNEIQETSCTVTAPTITRTDWVVIGFNTNASATEGTLANSGTLTLTSSNT